MNDEFLYILHEEPEREFVNSLRESLHQSDLGNLRLGVKVQPLMSRHAAAKRLVVALMALSLAFGLALAISPAARAAVTDLIKTIIVRGTTVFVSNDVPAVKGEGESYSTIWTPVRPREISDLAKLPTWIPVGYILQERAALFADVYQEEQAYAALFEWKNKHGNSIQLKVSKGTCPNGEFWESGSRRSDCGHMMYIEVGTEYQPELILIHDQPALLFPEFQLLMNLSDPVQEWNPSRVKYDNRDPEALFLIWESDGMTMELATKSPAIWKEDLIRIAESIP
jgi:hypothetical protein